MNVNNGNKNSYNKNNLIPINKMNQTKANNLNNNLNNTLNLNSNSNNKQDAKIKQKHKVLI